MPNRDIESLAIFNVTCLNAENTKEMLSWGAGRLDGIIGVEINHVLYVVSIRYDKRNLTLEALTRKLRKTGAME
jgi:hypothetical protein